MRYPTNRPTNQPTDTASHRGALSHLKSKFFFSLVSFACVATGGVWPGLSANTGLFFILVLLLSDCHVLSRLKVAQMVRVPFLSLSLSFILYPAYVIFFFFFMCRIYVYDLRGMDSRSLFFHVRSFFFLFFFSLSFSRLADYSTFYALLFFARGWPSFSFSSFCCS